MWSLIFRWTGWLWALGLIAGQLTYYDDGHVSGLTRLAGVAMLLWWGWSVGVRLPQAGDNPAATGEPQSMTRSVTTAVSTRQAMRRPGAADRSSGLPEPDHEQVPPSVELQQDPIASIKQLANLYLRGLITEGEYYRGKQMILDPYRQP